jgi:hypothetical protein
VRVGYLSKIEQGKSVSPYPGILRRPAPINVTSVETGGGSSSRFFCLVVAAADELRVHLAVRCVVSLLLEVRDEPVAM